MIEKIFKTSRSAAFLSILSNTILVVGKIAIGVISGSVSVLSEGIHSSLDLFAAVIAFFSITIAGRPPDREHPYGHGKVENISGVVEAILIVVAGVLIIREAVHKLNVGGGMQHIDFSLGIMAVSVMMNLFVSRVLFRVARKTESPALEADAHHLSTDVMTSAGVVVGLALTWITGWRWVDPAAAFAVAGLIIYIGVKVMKTSFVDLIDVKLPEGEEMHLREIIERHEGEYVAYHKMRTRRAGAARYIDLHILFPSDQSVKVAHDLCEHIETEIKDEFQGREINITIHLEPGREEEAK